MSNKSEKSALTIDYSEAKENWNGPGLLKSVAKFSVWGGIPGVLAPGPFDLRQLFELIRQILTGRGLDDDDAENVRWIIRAGAQHDAERMRIEMSKEEYLGLKGDLNVPEGVDADLGLGTGADSEYTIEVDYK